MPRRCAFLMAAAMTAEQIAELMFSAQAVARRRDAHASGRVRPDAKWSNEYWLCQQLDQMNASGELSAGGRAPLAGGGAAAPPASGPLPLPTMVGGVPPSASAARPASAGPALGRSFSAPLAETRFDAQARSSGRLSTDTRRERLRARAHRAGDASEPPGGSGERSGGGDAGAGGAPPLVGRRSLLDYPPMRGAIVRLGRAAATIKDPGHATRHFVGLNMRPSELHKLCYRVLGVQARARAR